MISHIFHLQLCMRLQLLLERLYYFGTSNEIMHFRFKM